MSIRDIFGKYANFKSINLQVRGSMLPPALENMCMEVYNQGTEEITFTSIHPEWEKMRFFGISPEYWRKQKCKPGEWVFLPHAQYTADVPSGSKEIKVVVNVGDNMFKGNKYPSRPEVKKIRSFVNKNTTETT